MHRAITPMVIKAEAIMQLTDFFGQDWCVEGMARLVAIGARFLSSG